MPRVVNVRALQSWIGIACLLPAAIAVARSDTPIAAVVAAASLTGAYFTGRTVPDFQLKLDEVLRASPVGLIIIVAGIAVDLAGGSKALGWAYVVMAYCAGNRLKAAGIGLPG